MLYKSDCFRVLEGADPLNIQGTNYEKVESYMNKKELHKPLGQIL
jgi:hypothetical protein